MPQYNFHNFDDHEFELLCRDLFNEEQRLIIRNNHGFEKKPFIINFSSFKRGADGGIDLYFSHEKEKIKVIGQVKLSRGKFKDVFAAVKKKGNGKNELDKVRAINPSKYVFMTSVSLSLNDKKALKEYFQPYIMREEDIYGLEDLNKLIGQFERIERRYLKLYFHSPIILENLLNKATLSRSSFDLSGIKEEFSHFVQTSHFGEALDTLENQRILIIKGPPGAGKTTLAKMLALSFAYREYQFVSIDDLDNELERLLQTEEKAIYYYDDFLGSNELILRDALRNEAKLNRLIRLVSSSKTKFLLLTSRTTILNNAKASSEKLRGLFEKVQKFELNLDNLSLAEKENILKRHVDRNQISKETISDELVDFIVNYKTFSPRLIQFLTDRHSKNTENFEEFARKSILYPDEVWKYAYQKEIDFTCQLFLNHLFLFGFDYDLGGFQSSFENRIAYETKINNFTRTGSEFSNCIERLDDAFIRIQSYLIDPDEISSLIRFFNPSVVDFLLKEIRNNRLIIKNSIKSFDNLHLLTNRFDHNKQELLLLFSIDELKEILLGKDPRSFLFDFFDTIQYLKLIKPYFTIEAIEDKHKAIISECLSVNHLEASSFEYVAFLKMYDDSSAIKEFITENLNTLANTFFGRCSYQEEFDDTINLFEALGYPLTDLLPKIDITIFQEAFKRMISEAIEQLAFIKSDHTTSYDDVDEIAETVCREFDQYREYDLDIHSIVQKKIGDIDWESTFTYNKNRYTGGNIG